MNSLGPSNLTESKKVGQAIEFVKRTFRSTKKGCVKLESGSVGSPCSPLAVEPKISSKFLKLTDKRLLEGALLFLIALKPR